jgi:predicted DsbA family dithiol-disulfide isomerase
MILVPDQESTVMTLQVEVVSDVICPWCFVGKRRLERAIAELGLEYRVEVRWHPFELNPDLPQEGVARREYRQRKFGSWERSQELDRQVAQAGLADGIRFAHDRIERTPNTFAAHRLLWLAGRHGVQDAVAEQLFRGYFEEGVDIGQSEQLYRIGADAGLEAADLDAVLHGDAGAAEVRAEEDTFRQAGISGVPFFILNGELALSGAQPPELFLQAFRQLIAEDAPALATRAPDGACAVNDPRGCP